MQWQFTSDYYKLQTSLKRTPLWESSFSSLVVEVTTNSCLTDDGAKQTWRAESTMDLSAVMVLISTRKTSKQIWKTLLALCKPANNSQSSVKRPTNFGFWRAKAWPGLSLSLPFFLFLTYQTCVLTHKTWSFSDQMTTLLSKVICRLVMDTSLVAEQATLIK